MDLQKAAEIDQGIADLKILQNRLRGGLEKSERGARAVARFRRLAREYEKRWNRPVAQWHAEMKARLEAGLRRNAGMRLTEPSVDKLIDWDEFDKWTINHFKPIMSETLSAGGNSVMRERRVAKAGGGFDPLTQAALDWLSIHALDLVKDINGKSRLGLIQMILDGIAAGTNPRDIAIGLRKYVGITGRMAQAAASREAWIIVNRPELGPAAIKGAMDAYVRKQIRYRAEMIARTETAYGLNEGIREGYGQLGYTKLQRIEDPEGDPEWDCDCRENNGTIYTLEESEGILPAHPNCEGTWVAYSD